MFCFRDFIDLKDTKCPREAYSGKNIHFWDSHVDLPSARAKTPCKPYASEDLHLTSPFEKEWVNCFLLIFIDF